MIIVITGPTGTGKTKLSVEIAKKFNGEIINADSTQIYKGLDIATAKVTSEEKENIPHHLFDIKELTEDYTVFDYQRDARKIIGRLIDNNKTPIVVGGTGLYIKALLYDYKFTSELKKKDYSIYTTKELYEKALEIDNNLDIHANNRQRLERFLDYYDNNGKSLNEKEKATKLLYDTVFIGLTMDRDILYKRLNSRVDLMITKGLMSEAEEIYKSGIRTKAIMTPIGYKELFPYFEGNEALDNCLELIKKRTRNYAKRQYTWFNHQIPVKWFNVDLDNFDQTIKEVTEYINEH